jgi:hypothetical protein
MPTAPSNSQFSILNYIKSIPKIHKPKLSYLTQLIFIVVVYGFFLNFALNQLFGLQISIGKIFSIGIIAYILKVEVPYIVSQCFPPRPPVYGVI